MRVVLGALVLIGILSSGYNRYQDDTNKITDKAKQSIDKGMKWLLKAQNKDGSWGIDIKTPGDITCTALGAMALMAAGNTEKSGPDPEAHDAIQRAYDWLLAKARKNPKKLSTEQHTMIQGKLGTNIHIFMGAVFLTQAYGMRFRAEDSKELKEIIQKLVDQISATQDSDGSWQKQSFGGLKATSQAWLGLRSADRAGVSIKHATVDKTIKFIKSQFSTNGMFDKSGFGGYTQLYNTTSSIRVLCGMGQADSKEVNAAWKAVLKMCKGGQSIQFLAYEGEDYMAASLMTQSMLIKGGEAWDQWYEFVREALIKKQNSDGSWTGTACISGRTFATTNALIALLTPLRHLPIAEI